MTTLKADPSLGTTGLDGAIRSMITTINSNTFFAPLVAIFSNATQTNAKNIWVTTEAPITGGPYTEAMYDWQYNTISGGFQNPRNWSNATSTGAGTAAAGQGIAVVKVNPPDWSLQDTDPTAGIDMQWSRGGWPGNGAAGVASVGRMIVHELAHGVTDPLVVSFRDTVAGHEFNYNEEIASFIENVYYVGYAKSVGLHDTFLAKGHEIPLGGYPHEMGAFGVSYFDSGSIPAISVDRTTKDVSFTDNFLSEGGAITKKYFDADTVIHGNSYSRYITVEYNNYNGIIGVDADGKVELPARMAKIIAETVVTDPTAAMQTAVDTRAVIDDISNKQYSDANTDDGTYDVLTYSNLSEVIYNMHVDQYRYVSLGADRYFSNQTGGAIDVAGPTAAGTAHNPVEIAIDDSIYNYWDQYSQEHIEFEQPGNTIIVGASGVGTAGAVLDTLQSHDWIKAGEGDDMLIGGKNLSTVGNTLDGGIGSDMLIEGTAHDKMFGGDGIDTFVMTNAHLDAVGVTVSGGAGFDIASYVATGAISYDKATGKASHDGRQDTLGSIGMVIGSDHADTFKGDAMVFVGGAGNDVFRMGSQTTAIGGEGADEFRITMNTSGTANYLLVDFQANDKIFINDVLQLGSTRHEDAVAGPSGPDKMISFTSGNAANPYATSYLESQGHRGDYWTEELLYGTQSQSNMTDELTSTLQFKHFVGGSLASTTNIYMTAFHPGEGGIEFNDHSYQYQGPITIGSMFDYGIL
jgi:hypothetical protein